MQKIAITVDVLRSLYPVFETAYEKHLEFYLDEKNSSFYEFEENGDLTLIDASQKRYFENPKDDPFRITRLFAFYSKEEYENFIIDNSFNLFGISALTYPEVISDVNKVYSLLVNKGDVCTIISNEWNKTKSHTLYWLATNKVLANRYLFLTDYSKIWQAFDVVITSNPYILKRCNLDNEKKTSIKIITEHNKDIEATISLNNLSEIFDYIL